jgi:hypothetical protein
MNDASKVKPNHLQRAAYVYIRQSSQTQVENNRESTARQYEFRSTAAVAYSNPPAAASLSMPPRPVRCKLLANKHII